ncbi:MAG: molybdopterin-synthase adenylyltransferase MoeB, partial [Bacteroidetes bacterium]|nr:molybdopterin-synthase adenylyltransferase MoeB [Bacteroidota bacterium]
ERARYARHLLLPQVGEEGQQRLKAASILIVGAGGLGAPLLQYLAAAGVGRIGIVDDDVVSLSNLQRQVLFGSPDVGRPKVDVAVERLRSINPHVILEPHPIRLTPENAIGLISGYDLVADGTDNFATRYLVNDACVLTGRPNIYASIFRFDGQVSVFGAEDGPCYRCLFPDPPPPGTVPSCAEGGVLGVLPGLVGSMQAAEAIKWILGLGESLVGRLLLVDTLTMDMRILRVPRDPACPICGEHPTIRELQDYEAFCAAPTPPTARTPASTSDSARPTTQPASSEPVSSDPMFFGPRIPEITVQQLHAKQQAGEEFLLLDVRQPEEQTIAHIGGTLVPMDQLPTRLPELAPDQAAEIVVMCRSGSRSAHVVAWMMQQGYTNVFNLSGGTNAWSRNIDPSVPVY